MSKETFIIQNVRRIYSLVIDIVILYTINITNMTCNSIFIKILNTYYVFHPQTIERAVE